MFDFQRKGYTKYGADMGRVSDLQEYEDRKLSLVRVHLDSGGYDRGGAYWGVDLPLYCATDFESGEVRYLRAASREAAKLQFEGARFFR